MNKVNMRIIGESPPQYGGKLAHSTVMPLHVGECSLHYEVNRVKHCVRFANYPIARTAAIQAIFSLDHDIDRVCITEVKHADLKSPLFRSAKAWLVQQAAIAA